MVELASDAEVAVDDAVEVEPLRLILEAAQDLCEFRTSGDIFQHFI